MPRQMLLGCIKGNNNSVQQQNNNSNGMNNKPTNVQNRSYDCGQRRRSRSQPSRINSNKKVRFHESPMQIQLYSSSPVRHIPETISVHGITYKKQKLITKVEASLTVDNDKYYSCEED